MADNYETTTNYTSYIQGYGPDDEDRDVAPHRRSSRLTMPRGAMLPVQWHQDNASKAQFKMLQQQLGTKADPKPTLHSSKTRRQMRQLKLP